MLTASVRERACNHCGKPFLQLRPLQYLCGLKCAIAHAQAKREGKKSPADRARLQAMKSLRQLLAEAQTAFNAYIRLRDAGTTCVCCGNPFEPQKPGGSMDAGHYLARSIAPQHRFNEDNVFGQRKNCNRPGGATRAAFRAGVIARIGLRAVEALEADTSVPKWGRDELVALKKVYQTKLKELRT